MDDIAIIVKTFKPDASILRRAISSISRYNVTGIPLIIIVPDQEVNFFINLARSANAKVLSESALDIKFPTEEIHHYRLGYLRQQFVKLSLHRLGVASNYVAIDSDSYFIRPFTADDFVDGAGRGYTVLAQDKDQAADPGYEAFIQSRQERVATIGDYFGLPKQPRATCHNNQILISEVLEDFEAWRERTGISIVDLMHIAVLEYTWYNFFLQRFHPDKIIPIEPLFRMIHTRSEFRSVRQRGITEASLSHAYLGVCINSGWAGRHQLLHARRLARTPIFAQTRIKGDRALYRLHEQSDLFRLSRRGASV